MKKIVKLTESDIERIVKRILENEEDSSSVDSVSDDMLYKTEYISDDKSIMASYYVLNETDKYWEVLNIYEKENTSRVWADGLTVYYFYPKVFKLPKSQVQQIGEIGNTGYYIFKIPYWLFKKEPKMDVRRINKPKRFGHVSLEDIEKEVSIEQMTPALMAIGTDEKKLKGLTDNIGHYRNMINK